MIESRFKNQKCAFRSSIDRKFQNNEKIKYAVICST